MYQLADHLAVMRFGGFDHDGIYVGHSTVTHFTNVRGGKSNARITTSSLETFRAGGMIRVIAYSKCDPVDVVLARARIRQGDAGYDVVANNCQHFAEWCKTGIHRSRQVETVKRVSAAVVLGGAAGWGVAKLVDSLTTADVPVCGARTQRGGICQSLPVNGNKRCAVHRGRRPA